MGLLVRELTLENWRNFTHRNFIFSDGVTILIGPNAVGKTNTIEALQMLTSGVSFRHSRPVQIIKEGSNTAHGQLKVIGDGRLIDISCDVSSNKRNYTFNGKSCRLQDLPHTLMSVLFTPDDLSLIKRSATIRRDEIDSFGSQINNSYGKVLGAYLRSIEQRNHLLKNPHVNEDLLDAWDISVATGAAALLFARVKLFLRLREKVSSIYYEISDGEKLDCSYSSTLGDVYQMSKHEMETSLLNKLNESRTEDLRRQQTTIGPHHDDFSFLLNSHDARVYGSQGQQRTAVLAWKMAEVGVVEDILGIKPLLLLDDVMSELDQRRRNAIVSFVKSNIQTIISTTNLDYFSKSLLIDSKVVHFDRNG